MNETGEDWNGLHLGKIEKRRPTFFQIYDVSLYMYQNIIYSAGKPFSVVVAMILQMKNSWSANLTFRAHNNQN